jgi:hypothetical protein
VDASVTSGLFALGGALLGAAASVAAQWVTARNAEVATRRAEVRSMFKEFLAAAKPPERLLERKRSGEEVSWERMAETTEQAWLAYQVLAAFCPDPLVQAANAYIDAIYAEWDAPVTNGEVGEFLGPARTRLTLEARRAFSELA